VASISFTQPQFLWAFVSLPILVAVHYLTFNYAKSRAFEFSNFQALVRVSKGFKVQKNILLLVIRIITLISIILAISGMTFWYKGEGSDFDFILAIDASSSMLTEDYEPNRLESAKETALFFIDNVPAETKIGVLSFAGTSFIKQNLIDDRFLIKQAIKGMEAEQVGGTDLGDAIVTGTNMLFNSDKGRAVVLLTDGRSNVGIFLDDALEYVKKSHVLVHAVGVGTEEGGFIQNVTAALKLDEESLKKISSETGGLYFIAENKEKLKEAFDQISRSTAKLVSINLSVILLLVALGLSLLDWSLINTSFKRIP